MTLDILQINTSLDKGTGTAEFLLNYYRVMRELGFKFDFVIHRVSNNNYIDEVKNYGSKVYVLPRITAKSYLEVRGCVEELAREVGNNYNIVHCHTPNAALLHLPVWERAGIARRIIHCHTTKSSPYRARRIRNALIEPFGLRFATEYLASSSAAGMSLFGNKPFTVIPNAIDLSKFKCNFQQGIDIRNRFKLGNKTVLGYVGRLAKGKNVDFLIDILAEMLTSRNDFVLMLVGDGEERDRIENRAIQKGIERFVVFVGYQSNPVPFYNAMDILLFPSTAEGLGLVAVEAQACGTPCVLSNAVPAEADVSGTSVFVPLNQGVGPWIKAIDAVLTEKKVIDSNKIVESPFNINRSAKLLADYYRGEQTCSSM